MVEALVSAAGERTAEPLDLRRGIVLSGATEQMYFFGAPLAHVVAYEEWRREQRLWQTYRRQARINRGGGLSAQLIPRAGA